MKLVNRKNMKDFNGLGQSLPRKNQKGNKKDLKDLALRLKRRLSKKSLKEKEDFKWI